MRTESRSVISSLLHVTTCLRALLATTPVWFEDFVKRVARVVSFPFVLWLQQWRSRAPVSFNEKTRYKMVRDRRPLLALFADKVRVRDYVRQHIGEGALPRCLGVHESAAEIVWGTLPREFVLKASHASGGIIVVADVPGAGELPEHDDGRIWGRYLVHPDRLNPARAMSLLQGWLRRTYGQGLLSPIELAYRKITPRILIEEFVPGSLAAQKSLPTQVMVHCLHGEPAEFVVVGRAADFREQGQRRYLAEEWQRCAGEWQISSAAAAQIQDWSRQLSAETDMVRVDWHLGMDGVRFNELTNYPAAGRVPFTGHASLAPETLDRILGARWQVPTAYRDMVAAQDRPCAPVRSRKRWKYPSLILAALTDFSKRVALVEALNHDLWPRARGWMARYRSHTRKRQHLSVVVGSFGKTTATRAVMAVLQGRVPGWLHESDNCFSLIGFSLLRQGPLRPYAVVEVGIGAPNQMGEYAGLLRPDLVVFTGLGADHWLKFGSVEKLWQEKALMIRSLGTNGVAVLNGDDQGVLQMAQGITARTVRYGFSPDCDIRAGELQIFPGGTAFMLSAEGQSWPVQSRLIGRESVRALLAAVAVGRVAGLGFDLILKRLALVAPTPGRMQPMPLGKGAVAICDDFKASIETVHAALEVFSQVQATQHIVVLGDLYRVPSPRVRRYEEVARQAAQIADHIILLGNRSKLYLRGLQEARPACTISVVASVEEAAVLVREKLQSGGAVLIKGRGEQKLSRIALALSGRDVQCRLARCPYENVLCAVCPQLGETGRRA